MTYRNIQACYDFFCCTDSLCLLGLKPDTVADMKHAGTASSLGAHYQIYIPNKYSSNQQLSKPQVWSLSDLFFFLVGSFVSVFCHLPEFRYKHTTPSLSRLWSAPPSAFTCLYFSFGFVLLPRSPCLVSKWEDDDDDGQNAGSVMNPAHLPCASSDRRGQLTG